MLDDALIQEIVRRILTVAQPEKIILFGSAATGEMTKDSDIDLLILERTVNNPRRESVIIRDAIGSLGRPFDILIIPADRFEATKNYIGGIAYPANKYGKVIYNVAA